MALEKARRMYCTSSPLPYKTRAILVFFVQQCYHRDKPCLSAPLIAFFLSGGHGPVGRNLSLGSEPPERRAPASLRPPPCDSMDAPNVLDADCVDHAFLFALSVLGNRAQLCIYSRRGKWKNHKEEGGGIGS